MVRSNPWKFWTSWVTQCFSMFYPMTSGSFWELSFKSCFLNLFIWGRCSLFFLLVQCVCFEVAAAQELPILTLLMANFQSPYIHYITKMNQGVWKPKMRPSLKLSARTWTWMVGILVSFWGNLFQVRTVSFMEGTFHTYIGTNYSYRTYTSFWIIP